MYYIGIDLGTSAVKLLLMDETGSIANIVSREYPIAFPHPGWSEQDPADWWAAVCDGIPALLDGFDASQVKGIGAGGQMHGLVVLDKNDTVIRPCILWNDGRTQRQVDYLNGVIGKDKLSRYTANIAFAGFTAPKLLWMRENEPDNFARIEKIMAEIQKLGVDASNQTRSQDREDIKTVADIQSRQVDQAMSAQDRQRAAVESEHSRMMGERQQSFSERRAEQKSMEGEKE